MDETTNPRADIPPDDPHGQDDQRLSEAAWEAIDTAIARLEDGWQRGTPPDIGTLVPADVDPPTQRSVLIQLVGIDLEWRWKTADATVDFPAREKRDQPPSPGDYVAAPLPPTAEQSEGEGGDGPLPVRPRLADYAARYPALGPVERLPVDLPVNEYYARRRHGDRPAHDEYLGVFGPSHPDLAGRLQAIDDEIAATDHRPADRPGDGPATARRRALRSSTLATTSSWSGSARGAWGSSTRPGR